MSLIVLTPENNSPGVLGLEQVVTEDESETETKRK